MQNDVLPLEPDIRTGGRIAQLARSPRTPKVCGVCGRSLLKYEPRYNVTWAGAGLGSIKFPSYVCAGCIYRHLGVGHTFSQEVERYAALIDWLGRHREDLAARGHLGALAICATRIYDECRRLSEMKELEIGPLSDEDADTLRSGKCPACGSEHFVEGPRGGLASNIACENGHRFWTAGPFTPEYQGVIRVMRKGDLLEAYF